MAVNVASAHCDTLDFSPLDECSSLIFYNVSKHPRSSRQGKARALQAGTPLGLMAYLYSRCSCWRLAGMGLSSRESKREKEQRNRPEGDGRGGESLGLPLWGGPHGLM